LVSGCPVCETGQGHCSDGVCCDTPCDQACDVCAAALGAPADGTCGPAPAGSAGNPVCPYAKCDGKNTSCAPTCTDDSNCTSVAYCRPSDHTCQRLLDDGVACASGDECHSTFCVDGYCCGTACAGQCEACDVANHLGVCTPVAGTPHGMRTPCSAGDGMDPCTRRACDGSTCAPVVGGACHEASCKDDEQTLAATCDGSGTCPLVKQSCVPHSCDGTSCRSGGCTTDTDCAKGYRCTKGACVEGARCDGDHTLTLPSGALKDCSPFRCTPEGTCLETCASTADCRGGLACTADGQCLSEDSSGSSDGCGCLFAGVANPDEWEEGPIWLLAGLVALARRRRQSQR
jgi:hypothetical protein